MTTIRDHVRAIQAEVAKAADLLPDRAAELLMESTALMGNVNDEIREADSAYAVILLHELDTCEKANRARIKAETSTAYQRKREARDTHELLVELARSLKYFLRAKADESRFAHHQ